MRMHEALASLPLFRWMNIGVDVARQQLRVGDGIAPRLVVAERAELADGLPLLQHQQAIGPVGHADHGQARVHGQQPRQ